MVRECLVRFRDILVGDHAAFVSDGLNGKVTAGDRDFRVDTAVIPTQFLDEQGFEIELLQVITHFLVVEVR